MHLYNHHKEVEKRFSASFLRHFFDESTKNRNWQFQFLRKIRSKKWQNRNYQFLKKTVFLR